MRKYTYHRVLSFISVTCPFENYDLERALKTTQQNSVINLAVCFKLPFSFNTVDTIRTQPYCGLFRRISILNFNLESCCASSFDSK